MVWRPQRTPEELREGFSKNILLCRVNTEEWKRATCKGRNGKTVRIRQPLVQLCSPE